MPWWAWCIVFGWGGATILWAWVMWRDYRRPWTAQEIKVWRAQTGREDDGWPGRR